MHSVDEKKAIGAKFGALGKSLSWWERSGSLALASVYRLRCIALVTYSQIYFVFSLMILFGERKALSLVGHQHEAREAVRVSCGGR